MSIGFNFFFKESRLLTIPPATETARVSKQRLTAIIRISRYVKLILLSEKVKSDYCKKCIDYQKCEAKVKAKE